MLAVTSLSRADDFPPFLPSAEQFSPDVRAEVAAIWNRRTTMRTASGRAAPVPLELYRLFIDMPDVTATAGQHLGVGAYRVTRLGPETFEVADGEGAKGIYRVVLRRPNQRVLIAKIERTTRLFGPVSSGSVTLLTLSPEASQDGRPQIAQRVDTAVRIDHRVLSVVAKLLLPAFPNYADRKISEIFNIAAEVSAWAYDKPADFCRWLGDQPDGARLRQEFAAQIHDCAG